MILLYTDIKTFLNVSNSKLKYNRYFTFFLKKLPYWLLQNPKVPIIYLFSCIVESLIIFTTVFLIVQLTLIQNIANKKNIMQSSAL